MGSTASSAVSAGQTATATQYNNLRTDILSGHDHDGTHGDGTISATAFDAAATVSANWTFTGTITVGVDDTGKDVKMFGATAGSYWLWDESADGVVQIGTLTVGVNDAGHDVKFFGATSGAYMLWDESADDLVLAGAAGIDLAGDIDVDGTANLDVVDIDGNVQIDGTVTVGVDDTGKDVKFFGATSGAYLLWDESADKLLTAGNTFVDIVKDKLMIGSTAVTTTAAELNLLDGVSGLVQADLTKLAAIDATAAELNLLDGSAKSTSSITIADADAFVVIDGTTTKQIPASDIKTYAGVATAADDIGTGDGAVNLVTTSGNITIDAQANDTDVIIKVDDNGSAVTAVTFDGSDEGNAIFVNDVQLKSDGALLEFGADLDTTLTHTDGTGLTLNSTNKLAFGDTGTFIHQSSDGVLTITSDTTVDINGAVDIDSGAIDGTVIGANSAAAGTFAAIAGTTGTFSGVVDITDTTDSSDASGDTGALRTEGGASIAKKLYVGTDLDVDGTAELDNITIGGSQGSDGQVLTSTGSAVAWEDAGGGGASVVQFTGAGAGTWTKPDGAVFVRVIVLGAGGGGGSGRRGADGGARSGGSGGGGGGHGVFDFLAADLAATTTVTVGGGGTAGPAITANDTNGTDGTDGGATTFKDNTTGNSGVVVATANGGKKGLAGTASGAAGVYGGGIGVHTPSNTATGPAMGGAGAKGGTVNGGLTNRAEHGGGGSGAGTIHGAGEYNIGGVSQYGGGGGAGGACLTSANAQEAGSVGGAGNDAVSTGQTGGGGTAGSAGGGDGGAGAASAVVGIGGSGGGGGGSDADGAGGTGGAGGQDGGGGGGGAGSANGNNSGAGGAGGDGYCIVISYA